MTVIVTSAVMDSYLACSNLEPLDTGFQVVVSPALKLPSAVFVQFSIGNVIDDFSNRLGHQWVFDLKEIDVEDTASSRLCISPCPTVISI